MTSSYSGSISSFAPCIEPLGQLAKNPWWTLDLLIISWECSLSRKGAVKDFYENSMLGLEMAYGLRYLLCT